MAQLCIIRKPLPSFNDALFDARRLQLGMVVDVLEDGVDPGRGVVQSDWFRVVEVPGAAKDYTYLLTSDPEFFDDKVFQSTSKYPRMRVKIVDIGALEAAANAPSIESAIPLEKATLSTYEVLATKADNPDVFGEDL